MKECDTMAARPWATPKEVRDYSDKKAVQERTDARLAIDISRAEQYVISYTKNDFSEYEEIPQNVKTAVILLAEAYGYNSVISSNEIKSETFDDYSYTAENSGIDFGTLGIEPLLEEFVNVKPKNGITMRLRRL
ncbi:DUF3199 family protein [Porcipelethomonas sp.]|uniref:DUF3199 family protein n=1 Tax=Porcipelethomonas sp. TaxID=2981675 RepID=UPI003EF09185